MKQLIAMSHSVLYLSTTPLNVSKSSNDEILWTDISARWETNSLIMHEKSTSKMLVLLIF